jgi:2-polyprenyl-6-methoxyphenol hydroxylase-like FAD-dependent oxidoreductase
VNVLVVGAGPTGLTMAIELARRGVDVRIIDASAGPAIETRALGVQARTLELFDKISVADSAVSQGLSVPAFSVFSENKQIVHVNMGGLETPYPFTLMLPQHKTETLLAERLGDFGVKVERRVELASLTQDSDSVQATLRHADGSVESAEVAWLVGCDGARSTVRSQLGVPFVGTAFEENFAVADLRMDWPLPHNQFYAFLNRGNFVAYFPMPAADMYRTAVGYAEGQAPNGEVSSAELEHAVDRCAPRGARVEVQQSARFRINQRRVARHSVGRVFLAGDAAHVHSVVGAQGMNTGIQDAFNLGWKLAAVIQNRARPELLDTYQSERAPVIRRLVKGTRAFTRLVLLHNPLATAARRNIVSRVMSHPGPQRTLTRALSEMDVSYRSQRRIGKSSGLAVGDRAPDARIKRRSSSTAESLFDVLDGDHHTLLVFGSTQHADCVAAVAGYADQARLVQIARDSESMPIDADAVVDDPNGQVGERYDMPAGGYALIRPDGYIGALGNGGDTNDLRRYLRDTFT